MLPDRIHETHLKIALFLALLIIFGGIHLLIPDFYATVWDLSMSGNLHGTIDYLRSFLNHMTILCQSPYKIIF